MAYQKSNPKSTTPIQEAWDNREGQINPINKRQGHINPNPHGFNKASRKEDPRTWGG